MQPIDSAPPGAALAFRARVLSRFAEGAEELGLYGCQPGALRDALGRSWRDSPPALEARRGWPEFQNPPEDWIATAAGIFGVEAGFVRAAMPSGWVRFTAGLGAPAVVLCSDCGRAAEAWRLDGGPWLLESGFGQVRSLPGASALVPYGLRSLTPGVRAVALAAPSSALVPMVGLLSAELWDCGLVCFPSREFKLCRELVSELAGRRVRLFLPVEDSWAAAEAEWVEVLEAAGCEVDAFDFGAFNTLDGAEFAKVPLETRDFELMAA